MMIKGGQRTSGVTRACSGIFHWSYLWEGKGIKKVSPIFEGEFPRRTEIDTKKSDALEREKHGKKGDHLPYFEGGRDISSFLQLRRKEETGEATLFSLRGKV